MRSLPNMAGKKADAGTRAGECPSTWPKKSSADDRGVEIVNRLPLPMSA